MRELNAVTTEMVIYPIGKNPIYDEGTITITITDEAAGPFLIISQRSETLEPNEIRIELDELDLIHDRAHTMINMYENAMKLGEKYESGKD